jgi:tetratricopeptide (TPR) repeat protein
MMSPLLFLILLAAPQRRLEVCLSPGCMADGALASMEKLQALVPFPVVEGGCESLCGKGPVVIGTGDGESKKTLYKRIAGSSLLQLLEDLEADVPTDLVQGYELIENAYDATKTKDYEKAIAMLEEGINLALGPAKAHGGSMIWLGRALRSLATRQLATFENEAALAAIDQATEFDPTDTESWDVKAQVCEALKDAPGECAALQAYFAIPTVSEELPRAVANRRRTLGFRLQKLEREVPTQ